MRDVAEIAGVSTATVSRTLTNPDVVSKETREAIEAAIRQTGYTVNFAARNLRRQRTGGIVALVPSLSNPFFSKILAGIGTVLRGEGLNLLVADTVVTPDARSGILDYANRSRCDGLILLDGDIAPSVLQHDACPPVVQACEWVEGLDAPRIVADNAGGAREAVSHLHRLGHRRIGHLEGPPANRLTRERTRGFHSGLTEHGLPSQDDWLFRGDFTMESGRRAADAFIERRDRPSAVVCDNDEMALGFVAELQRHGLRVPADVSVIGFDDIEFSAHANPALTTVRQRRSDIGEGAARLMLDILAGRTPPADTVMPVELIERATTARPMS